MFTKEQLQILQDVYSKDSLDKGLFFLAKKFFISHPSESWENVNGRDIRNLLIGKKAFSKTEITEVSFAVFKNDTIIKAFLKFLPENLYKLLEKLLFTEAMDDTQINTLLSEDIVKRAGYNAELKRELYFFTVRYQRHYINYATTKTVFVLSLHPILKNLLANYFPKPLYYNLIGIGEIPKTDFHFTAQDSINHELPRLLSYSMQQNIKYNNTGRPADATLTKLQRVCKLNEFYTADDDDISKIRSMLMAGMLLNYSFNALTANNVDVIKEIFNKHYFKLSSPVFVLQQLKGWQHIHISDFSKDVEKNLQDVFRLLPHNKWISAENLHQYLIIRSVNTKPVTLSAALSSLTYDTIYMRGEGLRIPQKKEVDYKTYTTMVERAFVSGSVFLYAAFGLIEIACNNINTNVPGDTYYSAYDGLQYIRLTPLGAYVLGLTKSYETGNAGKANKLTFDEDSLIILAEGDLEVMNVTLASYAERLAANRFRITNGHFLKDCKNHKDIVNKIVLFKNTVGKILPPNWENYFIQLLSNAKAVKENTQMITYQLPARSKELHRLIAQDSVLKLLILKAENYCILVANADATKFKNRMKEFGYIVE